MADCFSPSSNTCPLAANCKLKNALGTATSAFLASLDTQTLAMLLPEPQGQVTAPVNFYRATAAA
jgi:DNA-binding IscR family transcriptional regulator